MITDLLALFSSPEAWVALATLTVLEVILGIDNIIFLAIVVQGLPKEQRASARRLGLLMAMGGRVAFLLSITWIIGLTQPIFTWNDFIMSWRDLVLFGGGLFLLAKATTEIHKMVTGVGAEQQVKKASSFSLAIVQIFLLDLVFSIDSVLTAVGLVEQVSIMIIAVVVAILAMMLAAGPISDFISNHPTTKMLGLAFLVLVGFVLMADGLHFHVPRGYLYAAIAFSLAVEALNLVMRKKSTQQP